jgi:hypothetical protein
MTVPTSGSWRAYEPGKLLPSKPGDIDTAAKVPVGTRAKFIHPTYGEGEFIYLLGVASTAAGDAVTWNAATFATTRAAAGAGIPWSVAFATAATVASTYGWYQTSGIAVGNKTKTFSYAAGIALGIATTALLVASSSLKELSGCWVAVVASATTTTLGGDKVIMNIDRPRLQGRIT